MNILFDIEKKPQFITQARAKGKYDFLIEGFVKLKADETIKIPSGEISEVDAKKTAQSIKICIHKKTGLKVGSAVQNNFIYIYKR